MYFRKYPSLVNCTSIDWFLNWPTEALKAVSDHYLLKMHGVIMESTQISPFNSVASGVKPPAESLEAAAKPRPLETITEGFEEKDDGSIIDKMNTARN